MLRYYQEAAVEAIYNHIRFRDDNPCVVLPTGSGKTHVIAQLVSDCVERWNRRVIVLAHVKELLEQAQSKLARYCPDIETGIYCAGLNQRDHAKPCTLASIQSIYKHALKMDPVDLIIVDEAHLIPTNGEGMYRTFIYEMKACNPKAKVVGLTATPYRTDSGWICGPDNILNSICYDAGVATLIQEGYLCPLKNKAASTTIDTAGIEIQGGDFRRQDLEAAADVDEVVAAAARELIAKTQDRHSTLIFCCGVAHAHHVADVVTALSGHPCAVITGKTPKQERADTLEHFKAGRIKYLANVNVLTTGFDAPNIDCVAMLRPTLSAGLYYQMVGRGLRVAEGKADCLVLDFSENIQRHGPINDIQPKSQYKAAAPSDREGKVCPSCESVVAYGTRQCPDCGHEWPESEMTRHGTHADTNNDIIGIKPPEILHVAKVWYTPWTKKNATPDDKQTIRVDYLDSVGFVVASEWICPEHSGYARTKFEGWWHDRCLLPADSVETIGEFMRFADAECLVEPNEIEVTQDGKFSRITPTSMPAPYDMEELERRLEAAGAFGNAAATNDCDDEDIPF